MHDKHQCLIVQNFAYFLKSELENLVTESSSGTLTGPMVDDDTFETLTNIAPSGNTTASD